MNKLKGNISDLDINNDLTIVTTKLDGDIPFKSIIIDNSSIQNKYKIGDEVTMMFKETEAIISNDLNCSISLQNRIEGSIKSIESGKLLSKVTVESKIGDIISIISTNAVNQLSLKTDSQVLVMVKLNEIMISSE